MRGSQPFQPSDFAGFPDDPSRPSGTEPVGAMFEQRPPPPPPPPQPNHSLLAASPRSAPGSLGIISTDQAGKHKNASGGGAKQGLLVFMVVAAICIGVFAVLVGREVANLTVIDDIAVGECVVDHFQPLDDTAEGEFFEILFVSRTDCAQAHAYEAYAAEALWRAGDVFPGVDASFNQGENYCQAQYEQFLGEGFRNTPYEFFTFVPTVDLWNEGHRDVQCFIGHSDGTTLVTGSLRGAGSRVAS